MRLMKFIYNFPSVNKPERRELRHCNMELNMILTGSLYCTHNIQTLEYNFISYAFNTNMRELVTPQRFFQDGGGSRKVISDTTEIIQNSG